MQVGSKRTAIEGTFNRWGVILAGGDGKRLLPLTRNITGDERPKQFCAVLGNETLLEQTRARVSKMIQPSCTVLVMSAAHKRYYAKAIDDIPPSHRLIQSRNNGTAPAILYSLMRLRELDPNALVAFFPSDHHFANETAFASQTDLAFALSASDPGLVILLGIVPDTPETSYGWIEPGPRLENPHTESVSRVARFWEKPSEVHASTLMRGGCLWNSFVMVGHVDGFLSLARRALPRLLKSFESIRTSILTSNETEAASELYDRMAPQSFSDDVLSASSRDLAVIRGSNLGWSDLGEPARVLAILAGRGVRNDSGSYSSSDSLTAAGASSNH